METTQSAVPASPKTTFIGAQGRSCPIVSQLTGIVFNNRPREINMKNTNRADQWIGTSRGFELSSGNVSAHAGQDPPRIQPQVINREKREELERLQLSGSATFCVGAGNRRIPEEPDPMRTAFERDRDRILHSSAFRRLAGKTQVFIFPNDHQRTRLTHALEVAQVASAVSKSIGLNVALTEAIAYGHDCGHGPGGHASEDAFSKFLDHGYDHATWGADRTLEGLNLCTETLDGVRNHSWSRPQPMTAEGTVVSFADRIAYCAHDLEDATRAGVVSIEDIPKSVSSLAGETRARQLGFFISDMANTVYETGEIALSPTAARVLGELREFNYTYIYMRPESLAQSSAVIEVLSSLVEYYAEHPSAIPQSYGRPSTLENESLLQRSINYVSGMTDRFAFQKAVEVVGFDSKALPKGIDLSWVHGKQ